MKFIIGKKIEMSQMFDEKGTLTPVTLVAAGPVTVLQKKTKEKEGYDAVQFGFEKLEKKSKIKKTMNGKEYRHVRELRGGAEGNVGDQVTVEAFKPGDVVTVIGVSKGKGFQGAVRRHGFHGRDQTHGMKHDARTLGSIGHRFPQHTIKGQRMHGRMGADRVTVKNLTVAKIDVANNIIALKGAVPGHRGTLLQIKGN